MVGDVALRFGVRLWFFFSVFSSVCFDIQSTLNSSISWVLSGSCNYKSSSSSDLVKALVCQQPMTKLRSRSDNRRPASQNSQPERARNSVTRVLLPTNFNNTKREANTTAARSNTSTSTHRNASSPTKSAALRPAAALPLPFAPVNTNTHNPQHRQARAQTQPLQCLALSARARSQPHRRF